MRSAYERAFATDRTSPFGGVIVFNGPVDLDAAACIDEIFSEIVAAPAFTDEALALLSQKKNRRLIRIVGWPSSPWQWTSILGGTLLQSRDRLNEQPKQAACVTLIKPTEAQTRALWQAWKVVRHVKSNGIVLADETGTLGIGTGQTSRIRSTEIAIANARQEGLDLQGSVLASDAFFPFADGVTLAAEAGVSCIIQPGGSVRDREVIDEADERGLAMLFTEVRHFRH
jgi:phosphoribosylaminoimidazolecarboxamide formyltransferase/IMP cyclohydrolase